MIMFRSLDRAFISWRPQPQPKTKEKKKGARAEHQTAPSGGSRFFSDSGPPSRCETFSFLPRTAARLIPFRPIPGPSSQVRPAPGASDDLSRWRQNVLIPGRRAEGGRRPFIRLLLASLSRWLMNRERTRFLFLARPRPLR